MPENWGNLTFSWIPLLRIPYWSRSKNPSHRPKIWVAGPKSEMQPEPNHPKKKVPEQDFGLSTDKGMLVSLCVWGGDSPLLVLTPLDPAPIKEVLALIFLKRMPQKTPGDILAQLLCIPWCSYWPFFTQISGRNFLIGCAKGIFARGILGGTGFSLLRWEKGSETPFCDGEKGLRLPRSSCSDLGNEGVSDPLCHRKRESQTLFPTAKGKTLYLPKSP